jgi:hypothetical protein
MASMKITGGPAEAAAGILEEASSFTGEGGITIPVDFRSHATGVLTGEMSVTVWPDAHCMQRIFDANGVETDEAILKGEAAVRNAQTLLAALIDEATKR